IAISADLFQFFSLFYRQMDFISATSSHFRVLTLAYLLHYFSCVSPLQRWIHHNALAPLQYLISFKSQILILYQVRVIT
ncbi:hypothetical protein, partial [Nostoc sp. DedVER01b]|uniref:hypothetical protein n=1 Tax=Nostoc sp. DedVER01b TaxID=3075404 RepID=UPI002AD3790C